MKLSFLVIAFALSSAAMAQSDSQKCFSIKNNLDRKYCMDKYLESVKDKMTAELKSLNGEIAPAAKVEKTAEIQNSIQMKKDQLALTSSEISLYEKHLTDVASLKDAAPAAAVEAPKKDKKKIKLPFGIKL